MAKEQEQDVVYKERKRWLFFGLPFTFTKYIIKDDMLTINQGFLKKVENDCYMYKVQDVDIRQVLASVFLVWVPLPAIQGIRHIRS